MILEVKVPTNEFFYNDLHITKVLFGTFKSQSSSISDSASFGNFGASGPCNINVLCSQGNAWATERKAVCVIQTDDGGFGSGALINNTCNSATPYILTAWHVTQTGNPNNWTYIFNWWSPTCTPNTYTSVAYLFNGASLVSTYEPTDFSLLLLNQLPTNDMGLTYLGWSRSSLPPTSSVCISHPQGDEMKIAFDINAAIVGNVRLNTGTAWRVLWTSGMTEPGSSGSPLFDQNNHLVVGQAFSNSQPIGIPCNQQTGGANYGRFDLSWDGGGSSSSRLKDWLDPQNINPNTLNTLDPNNQYSIQGVNYFCSSLQTYSLPNLPSGSTVTSWSVSPSGIVSQPSPSSGPQTSLSFIANGVVTLTATISNSITGCGNIQVQKTVQAGAGNAPNVNVSYDANCGSFLEGLVIATTPLTPIGTIGYRWTVDYSTVYNTLLTDQNGGDLLLQPFATPPKNGTSKHFLQVQANTACGLTAFNPYINVINIGPCTPGNGGGFINKMGQPTETDAVSSKTANVQLAIFPNPAHASLYITVPKDSIDMKHAFIKISDVYGKQLKTIPAASESNTIDVGNLASGVYIVEITDGKKRIVKKIVVQH